MFTKHWYSQALDTHLRSEILIPTTVFISRTYDVPSKLYYQSNPSPKWKWVKRIIVMFLSCSFLWPVFGSPNKVNCTNWVLNYFIVSKRSFDQLSTGHQGGNKIWGARTSDVHRNKFIRNSFCKPIEYIILQCKNYASLII